MENIQLTNDYYNKIKYLEFVSFFFAWMGIGAAIVEYELRYHYNLTNSVTDAKRRGFLILLSINTFCSVATCLAIVARYLLILKWKKEKKLLMRLDNLINTKYYKSLALEIIIIMIAPYPGLEDTTFNEVYYDKNASVKIRVNVPLLWIAMMIRLYLLVRFVLSSTRYINPRMQRLCFISGVEASFMYGLKAFK